MAKTHYAVNEGDYITNTGAGPTTLQQGDSASYPWVDTTLATGIAYQRSQVTPAMVTDGMSCTYMLGEKYVSVAGYYNYSDNGYDQSAYSGVDLDINRWVLDPPLADAARSRTAASAGLFGRLLHGLLRRLGAFHQLPDRRRDTPPPR